MADNTFINDSFAPDMVFDFDSDMISVRFGVRADSGERITDWSELVPKIIIPGI